MRPIQFPELLWQQLGANNLAHLLPCLWGRFDCCELIRLRRVIISAIDWWGSSGAVFACTTAVVTAVFGVMGSNTLLFSWLRIRA